MSRKPKTAATSDEVAQKLIRLKTPAFAACFKELISDPIYQDLTLLEAVDAMAERELQSRAAKRQERCLQRSGLRELSVWNQADPSKLICSESRHLKKSELQRLMTCEWIRDSHNVITSGATGTGKTWLLAVLGKQACLNGHSVLYLRYPQMLEKFVDARTHNETAELRHAWNNFHLLLIDDFGCSTIDQNLASDLLTLLEEREGIASVAIASQLPFEQWHQCLGAGLNADAIIDRLTNNSYHFTFGGNSLRERFGTCLQQEG